MPCKTHKSSENKIATNARRDISISQSLWNVNSYKSKAELKKCPYQCLKKNQDPITQGYLVLVDFDSYNNNKYTEQAGGKWVGPAQRRPQMSLGFLCKTGSTMSTMEQLLLYPWLFIHQVKSDFFIGWVISLASFRVKPTQSDKADCCSEEVLAKALFSTFLALHNCSSAEANKKVTIKCKPP